jgi:hypothetical protein
VAAQVKGLRSTSAVERIRAAKELANLKVEAPDAMAALTLAANEDEDEDVRAEARKTLDAIRGAVSEANPEKALAAMEPLIKGLRSKKTEERTAAIEKLGELGSQARPAGAALVEYGVLDPSPTIREAAAAALEKIDPEVQRQVVTLVFDGDRNNWYQAVDALKVAGSRAKAAMPALKFHYRQLMTGQRRDYTGGAVLAAMVAISPDDKEVVETVIRLISQPSDGRMLGRLSLTQEQALELLAHVKADAKKKAAALTVALADPSWRANAAMELGKLGPDAKDALPTLTKLKLDPDQQVRQAATTAIDLIKQ